ncbi:HGGxSTG domain-containing protein [Mesorhizobium sp. LjNodule214]|uniref:HGGxSTG domain-containing protein n=1 Tax=Mesorhizobium sp. LjNodule214 TaxID=3342252 RepID=UPI003F50CBD4
MKKFYAEIFAQQVIEDRRRAEAFAALVAAGPPDCRIEQSQWELWCKHKQFVCPSEGKKYLCQDPDCYLGSRCQALNDKGLFGSGDPLPKNQRPTCGANTRAKSLCQMRVVPGKHRCRLHGGMSTGPKSPEGRERIAEAQRRRWAARAIA